MAKHRNPTANSETKIERNPEPEHHLWISVLSRAMEDAFQSNDWNESLEAINWIKHDGGDFQKVCRLAGRSPLYIRERILQSLLEREAHIVNKIRTIRENVAECLSRKNVYNLEQVRLSQMNGKNER